MTSHFVGTPRQGDGLWSWNPVSDRCHFSPAWLRLVGGEEHEVGNTRDAWLQRVHPEDVDRVSRAIHAFLSDGSDQFEVRHRLRHKNGSYLWTCCRGVIQRNAAGEAVQVNASHTDVTAETVSDPLTGLPNRLLLFEHLTRSIERAGRNPGFHFALLCLDLGSVRDTGESGGQAFEVVLPAVARRLETCLHLREDSPTGRHDDLVARLHDDGFAILLDGLKEPGHATVAAERLLAEVLAPLTIAGREVHLSPSIGIALSATGYTRADDMMRDAETALHRAKILGRRRCEVFDTAVLRASQHDRQLEADFEGALGRGEFEVLYQPIVSLASNDIVGFEAVVRWRHPVFGVIPPQEFIPLAEKTGFIVPLGTWVLREACLQMKAWQETLAEAAKLWVSVNLSSRQFKHPTLLEDIADVLRDSRLDPRGLVLELTEGVALENPAAVRTVLMKLRALGVRISIDDFGTGYSSLAYLRQLPLDSLKVDRAFIRGIEANKDMVSILGAIAGMAQQLGLQVVAEGIEKEEQLVLVRSLECALGQGYLFSRPLDREEMTALLRTGLPPRQATPSGTDAAAPVPPAGRWSSGRMRSVYVAAAAVVLVVSLGIPRILRDETPAVSAAGTPVDIALRAPAAAAPVAPAVTSASAPKTSTLSMRAVHQHRLGSCRGTLVVARGGIAFVPDAQDGDAGHALRLGQGEFLHSVNEDSLTIRSSDKVYRFKPAVVTGKGDDQLARLVSRLIAQR
jgi:diguanylate cyclase (GGDEF)-like protein